MIRIVLLAGAAALGAKQLVLRKRKERVADPADCANADAHESSEETANAVALEEVAISKEDEETAVRANAKYSEVCEGVGPIEPFATLEEVGGNAAEAEASAFEAEEIRSSNWEVANEGVDGPTSPRFHISDASIHPTDASRPVVIPSPAYNDGLSPQRPSPAITASPSAAANEGVRSASKERPILLEPPKGASIGPRRRISNLRLEIEKGLQGDGFASPFREESMTAGIKAPPTPVDTRTSEGAPSVRIEDSDKELAFPAEAANGIHSARRNSSSSIRAPPTPSKELHTPQAHGVSQPLILSSSVRALPTRGRSRGPRASVNGGLLDILQTEGDSLWASPSNRLSAEPPKVRSSFSEGVLGALAGSLPRMAFPFSSRSGASTPVGSIRAPPTPMGIPKPLNPELDSGSPTPSVIRAVPTAGASENGASSPLIKARSLDPGGETESVTSMGTSVGGPMTDGASVVVSPTETESQQRVARERLSLKDKWEAQQAAEQRVREEATRLEKGPQTSHREAGQNGTGRNEGGTEPERRRNRTDAELRPQEFKALPKDLEGREKALREWVAEEEKRREGLRVLKEREAELKGRLAELERALKERQAADVAGGLERGLGDVDKVGANGRGLRAGVGAEDKFDQANFDCWCQLRTSLSDSTVHWYSTGELYSYPAGQLLARLEGFEAARARRESAQVVHELSRRLLAFVDKDTRAPLSDVAGAKLDVVRTPYQSCTYRLDGAVVQTEVTVGSGGNGVRLGGTAGGVRVMRGSDGVAFTRPMFLSIPSEKGDFLAYENHDYFTTTCDSGRTDHFSMVRLGPVPGFPGQCFVHMIGWKVDDLGGLPAVLRDELEKEPLWKEAPEKVYF